ncbi:hypothetical protein F4821DRAFT_18475 [Hypoxylon rubiginosum]|uniref:Uncharacterized protein n=1 Tax=Hypoxylon rubiginosum TaxID=110542 RepID=A0ACC0CN16_9PEZI|nr:hypothetical protein F4821DRAFT_18475 [Hypoxylon rubiginosum]
MSSNHQTSQTFNFQGKTLQEALEEVAMALPMILALTIAPALLGTQEAIRQSQSKNKREEHRSRRCNLAVSCVKQSIRSRDVHGKLVVLKDNKLYLTTGASVSEDAQPTTAGSGYPFSGYYLPYPEKTYEGLVSTISDDPPMLNWIYVDKDTYEVKYGVRADAQPHITGPFDCTRQDRRMTLEGWEGFVAVEEFPGIWALYFDRDDDGLVTKVPMGTRVLEVELTRREKKERKPEPDPNQAQTLDEKMKEHKEQTQREEEERQEMFRQQEQADTSAQAAEAPQQNGVDAIDHQPEVMRDISLDLGKLNLEVPNVGHAIPHSPSVATDNISFWSAARKGDGISDADSVTAASSIIDRNENDELGYKRPYVEDDPAPNEIEADVNST